MTFLTDIGAQVTKRALSPSLPRRCAAVSPYSQDCCGNAYHQK